MGHKHHGPLPPAKYHFLTPVYDLGCRLLGLGPKFRDRIIGHLELAGEERVLDVGCGTGVLAARIKERYPRVHVTGVDPTSDALAIARKRAVRKSLEIDFKEGSGEAIPFPSESFDRVVSSLAFHHLPPDKKPEMLRECLRVLRPAGTMLLVDFSESSSWWGRFVLRRIVGHEHLGDQMGRLGEFLLAAGFAVAPMEGLHSELSRDARTASRHFAQSAPKVDENRLGVAFYKGVKPWGAGVRPVFPLPVCEEKSRLATSP